MTAFIDAHRHRLVERNVTAAAHNQLLCRRPNHIRLTSGVFIYAAFIIDAFSRAIVGSQVATTMPRQRH
jgi:transposase InsO family protein